MGFAFWGKRSERIILTYFTQRYRNPSPYFLPNNVHTYKIFTSHSPCCLSHSQYTTQRKGGFFMVNISHTGYRLQDRNRHWLEPSVSSIFRRPSDTFNQYLLSWIESDMMNIISLHLIRINPFYASTNYHQPGPETTSCWNQTVFPDATMTHTASALVDKTSNPWMHGMLYKW
jgi:hypothetical protein